MYKDIFDLIEGEQAAFNKPIELEDGWGWSMRQHLRRSFLYKHSQFEDNNDNRDLRPFKNIIKPILNIQYRTEGFDVKDIVLYVDNSDNYHKSFTVKKFHEKWAVDEAIDTFIDEVVESYVDYGGALARNVKGTRPEVIDLRSLAFCNQSDILAYPFGILHKLSPSDVRAMDKWGDDAYGATISKEEFITLATKESNEIEVYEIIGNMPGSWIGDEEGDVSQVQVVAYYKNDEDVEKGVTLFKSEINIDKNFKLLKRDDIKGRALGWGGVEEMFEPQVWTNYSEIKIAEMLNSASKILYKSNDPGFKTRNNLTNVKSNEVLFTQANGDINQLDNYPRNLAVFNDSLDRWEVQAQRLGAASEGLLGETPPSGTPFKLFESQTMEAKGLHHYRQGKIAVFINEIYRKWILPELGKEVVKEQRFLSELSADEVMEVADKIVENKANKIRTEQLLNGERLEPKEEIKARLARKYERVGANWFINILKDELKDENLGISTNIAGKQKNLALLTDKIVNVLRQFISTPQIRQDPEMLKLLNQILESSGMSPMIFGPPSAMPPQQAGQGTQPLREMGQTVKETAPPLSR